MITPPADPVPFLPPQWFIDNYHEKNPGAPRRNRFDPVMVSLWQSAAYPHVQPLVVVTGI